MKKTFSKPKMDSYDTHQRSSVFSKHGNVRLPENLRNLVRPTRCKNADTERKTHTLQITVVLLIADMKDKLRVELSKLLNTHLYMFVFRDTLQKVKKKNLGIPISVI